MSGWPGTALHEQRIRGIREDHRIMLRHNIPLSSSICAIYDEVKDDVARFSTDESLSMHQKVLRIHNFIARIQFPKFFVILTKYRLLEIAYELASAWSGFPAVRSVSGAMETEAASSSDHGSTGSYKQEIDRLRGMADSLPYKDELPMGLLSMPVSKQQRVGSRRAPDPMMLVDFDRHTSILMRVWQWVLVDIRQITVWFETAADMVAYPFYMQLCLDRGMEIYAEMALYLQQYSDAMVHWLDFP
ncbi:uncharacterized protein BO72DRAFT_447852 [Aspergillus fijiensis CBS 313.89]|uniref:Uncharacterized protein n=1 Tax=Aspergillus fijiensis CBS 313.89 TaxID=1448319 RepID=A0A8G1RS82_9EURO|nr:uncharacterized protein BO72DRAFT_447852 [Aspergillus fijiensis CBS 313.89]RAK77727.1 hypothetical protein BO72DRAFT_447852 [Aspergillus fijiensis CBS 313.89]